VGDQSDRATQRATLRLVLRVMSLRFLFRLRVVYSARRHPIRNFHSWRSKTPSSTARWTFRGSCVGTTNSLEVCMAAMTMYARLWNGLKAATHKSWLRFVEGEGGSGKTRLAAEIARRLRERGWTAGFLRRSGPIIHVPSARGLFLTIDYPEEQPQRIVTL